VKLLAKLGLPFAGHDGRKDSTTKKTTDLQQNYLQCVACAYITDNTNSKAYDIVNY